MYVFRLVDREVELMVALDAIRNESREVLANRQQQAQSLRVRVDRASMLTDAEVNELRADIKLFVSDRKIDEDLAAAKQFHSDPHSILDNIKQFGTGERLASCKPFPPVTVVYTPFKA